MTAEEQDALKWLDSCCVSTSSQVSLTKLGIATYLKPLKSMLARPVLPEEPTPEMIKAMAAAWGKEEAGRVGDWFADSYRALYAHLTAPRTKEVEVWRVEYAEASPEGWIAKCESCDSAGEAETEARNLRISMPAYACIRVTGPHRQQVPA